MVDEYKRRVYVQYSIWSEYAIGLVDGLLGIWQVLQDADQKHAIRRIVRDLGHSLSVGYDIDVRPGYYVGTYDLSSQRRETEIIGARILGTNVENHRVCWEQIVRRRLDTAILEVRRWRLWESTLEISQ
jgi:hypothetical protein